MSELINYYLNLVHVNQMKAVMPIAAIWLEEPVIVDGQKRGRIMPGMRVKIDKGVLVDCDGLPTHEVTACNGNVLGSVVELVTVNIETKQAEFFQL